MTPDVGTITIGNGAGDKVDGSFSLSDTIAVGNGAGDTVSAASTT
jgi:hypothetical protein